VSTPHTCLSYSASAAASSPSSMWNSARCHHRWQRMKLVSALHGALTWCSRYAPSARRPSVSITWASACWAQGSAGCMASARRAAASARSSRWHCSQPKAARPCTAATSGAASTAGSASFSSVGASPRLKAWYWPSLMAARSRGWSCASAVCSVMRAAQVAVDPAGHGLGHAALAVGGGQVGCAGAGQVGAGLGRAGGRFAEHPQHGRPGLHHQAVVHIGRRQHLQDAGRVACQLSAARSLANSGMSFHSPSAARWPP
jgi:hypothetical protein